jgi:hypothetical protein
MLGHRTASYQTKSRLASAFCFSVTTTHSADFAKYEHWSASQADSAAKAAPMLEFSWFIECRLTLLPTPPSE